MSDSFHLGSEIICPETFNDVVQELGTDGNELLQAVQEDDTVFGPYNPLQNPNPRIEKFLPSIFIKNEPPEYQEDQKNFVNNWNGEGQQQQQQYPYNEHQMVYPHHHPQPPLQQPIAQIPANVDYAGDLDFDILISSHSASRNSWIYSSILKKVFINMQNVLPIDVKRNPANIDLFLRATLLYSLPQYTQEIVERCSTHVDPRMSTNRDVSPMIMKHVLRCNNRDSIYVGNTDLKQHLSVVTPLDLPQAGMDTVRVNYQFMCKNSCPSGMNRRAVDVIFTLEDRMGNVLGRRKLAVRVCSCPKRDKEKEEKEFRETNQTPTAYTRKRKISTLRNKVDLATSPGDDNGYQLQLKIPTKKLAVNLLESARNYLVHELTRGAMDEVKQEKFRESLDEVDTALRSISPNED